MQRAWSLDAALFQDAAAEHAVLFIALAPDALLLDIMRSRLRRQFEQLLTLFTRARRFRDLRNGTYRDTSPRHSNHAVNDRRSRMNLPKDIEARAPLSQKALRDTV